jgi:hypothetical protein
MEEKKLEPEAASTPSDPQREKTPWSPRVRGDLELNTNPFENFDQSGNSLLDKDSVNRTVTIRDPAEDTAPLQGPKDISDDDFVGGAT